MTFNYTSVITFGGYKDDFMLVIQDDFDDTNGRTGRHLFAMSKGKVCFAGHSMFIELDLQLLA